MAFIKKHSIKIIMVLLCVSLISTIGLTYVLINWRNPHKVNDDQSLPSTMPILSLYRNKPPAPIDIYSYTLTTGDEYSIILDVLSSSNSQTEIDLNGRYTNGEYWALDEYILIDCGMGSIYYVFRNKDKFILEESLGRWHLLISEQDYNLLLNMIVEEGVAETTT